jgi:hypothetical protein
MSCLGSGRIHSGKIRSCACVYMSIWRTAKVYCFHTACFYVNLIVSRPSLTLISSISCHPFYSIVSSVTIDVIERKGTNISIPDIVASAEKKMQDKIVYHVHQVPQLGDVSSTAIRTYQFPLFTLGGLLGGQYLSSEASASTSSDGNTSASSSDSNSNSSSVSGEVTHALQGLDPEVLNYIEKNELYFYSRDAKRKRVVLRLLSLGAACAAVSVGVVLFKRLVIPSEGQQEK